MNKLVSRVLIPSVVVLFTSPLMAGENNFGMLMMGEREVSFRLSTQLFKPSVRDYLHDVQSVGTIVQCNVFYGAHINSTAGCYKEGHSSLHSQTISHDSLKKFGPAIGYDPTRPVSSTVDDGMLVRLSGETPIRYGILFETRS